MTERVPFIHVPMSSFTLFCDFSDLMTIVRPNGTGWPGAYWSSGLFVTDALLIARGERGELAAPTQGWRERLEWPERIASWSRERGRLEVFDPAPGARAERYLGMSYDRRRWESLDPATFKVAVKAAASCQHTISTAITALMGSTPEQLQVFSDWEWRYLISEGRIPERGPLRARTAPRGRPGSRPRR